MWTGIWMEHPIRNSFKQNRMGARVEITHQGRTKFRTANWIMALSFKWRLFSCRSPAPSGTHCFLMLLQNKAAHIRVQSSTTTKYWLLGKEQILIPCKCYTIEAVPERGGGQHTSGWGWGNLFHSTWWAVKRITEVCRAKPLREGNYRSWQWSTSSDKQAGRHRKAKVENHWVPL